MKSTIKPMLPFSNKYTIFTKFYSNWIKNFFQEGVFGPISQYFSIFHFRNALCRNDLFSVYSGYDPTAPDVHIGHLLTLGLLKKFNENGHKVIILIGDSTSSVGDPSFRLNERKENFNYSEIFSDNLELVFNKISKGNKNFSILKNSQWYNNLNLLEFLTQYGKYFKIKELLSKENIKNRFDNGLNYSEFSYQLLQAYDFYKIFNEYNCKLQIGGSDQWGNIVSGIKLINSIYGENSVDGITIKLLEDINGNKMGKSVGNALWITGKKTFPLEVYQFLSTIDSKILKMLFSSDLKSDSMDYLFFMLFGEKCLSVCKDIINYSEKKFTDDELGLVFPDYKIIFNQNDMKIIDACKHIFPEYSSSFLREEIIKGKIIIGDQKPENPLIRISTIKYANYSFIKHNNIIKGLIRF